MLSVGLPFELMLCESALVLRMAGAGVTMSSCAACLAEGMQPLLSAKRVNVACA